MNGKERLQLSVEITARVLLEIPSTIESLITSVFKYITSMLFVIFGSFEPISSFSTSFSSKPTLQGLILSNQFDNQY